MGLFKTIAEGGQIWAHRVRMLRQVIKIAILSSLTIGVIFCAYKMALTPKVYYQAAWYYGKAHLLGIVDSQISVSCDFWEKIEHHRYSGPTIEVKREKLKKTCEQKLVFLWTITKKNLLNTISFAFKVFFILIVFFLAKGIWSRRKQHVTGQKKISPYRLALHLLLRSKASPFRLGSMPLVKASETRHILISGGTGSGKTNCFHTLLPQIRKKGQRAIIVDTSGEFVSKYYREGKDILLNPFDKRGVPWHPWCECHESYDYKTLAQSFIPPSHREDENFWRKSAQEVFSSLLEIKSAEKRISEVVNLLLYVPLLQLSKALQNTKAASFLDTNSEKTAGSIRAVAASFLECLEAIEDTATPFSIHDWVQHETDDSWLFLTSTIGQRASVIPLISAWFSTAMRKLLQMPPNVDRRLWFIADELPSLNRLKDLEVCLAESRKFGGCALLAFQSPAQLEMIYGRELTRIIVGNCATRIAFAEQDPETAIGISKTFGEKELRELQESISYGAHEMRDGINLSSHNKISPVVSTTEIQSLETNQAFVKVPGNLPITKIKLSYQKTPKICEPFLKKTETEKGI